MPVICIALAERHLGSKLVCLGFNNRMDIGKSIMYRQAKQILTTAEMRFLRKIHRISSKGRKTNLVVLQETDESRKLI